MITRALILGYLWDCLAIVGTLCLAVIVLSFMFGAPIISVMAGGN